jgi:hypothetical protein
LTETHNSLQSNSIIPLYDRWEALQPALGGFSHCLDIARENIFFLGFDQPKS